VSERKMRRATREFLEYPSVALMAERIMGRRKLGSPLTVDSYVQGIRRFVQDYLGCEDPEIALQKLKSREDSTKVVDGFIDWLLERYSYKASSALAYGVKKWLTVNDVNVTWKKIDMPTKTEVQEIDRAPTREELQRLLHYGSIRDKAVIEIATSSGLRIGTLLSLTWGDVDLDSYPDVGRIKVVRMRGRKISQAKGSTGQVFFITWITPEAKKMLLEYKRLREQHSEVITPQSPLIAHKGQFMNVESYERRWGRLLHRAGLDMKSQKWFKLHFHTLRKYFRTKCSDADVQVDYREHWMTHKGGYLDESYFRPEEEKHLLEYRKAVPHLSVLEAPTLTADQLRRKMVEDFMRVQGYSEEQIMKWRESVRTMTLEDAIDLARKLREVREEKKEEEELEDCQRIVKEGELATYLKQGWRFVAALSNGSVIIEKT